MIDKERYENIVKGIENFKNRIARRMINKNFTEEEEEIIEEAMSVIRRLQYGKTPTSHISKNKNNEYYEDVSNLESELFSKLKELSMIYFLLTSAKNPVALLNVFRKIEEECKEIEVMSPVLFRYGEDFYEIVKDYELKVSGMYEKEFISYNPKRIKDDTIEHVVKHEILHLIINVSGIADVLDSEVCISNIQELLCDLVPKHTNFIKIKEGVVFEN